MADQRTGTGLPAPFGIPIQARDDLPEGWVFVDKGNGTLEPVMAFTPEGDE